MASQELIDRCERAAVELTRRYPPGTDNSQIGHFARRLHHLSSTWTDQQVMRYLKSFEAKATDEWYEPSKEE